MSEEKFSSLRAELAHAEHDPAGAFGRAIGIGQRRACLAHARRAAGNPPPRRRRHRQGRSAGARSSRCPLSPPRSASAIRKCASSFSVRSAAISVVSETPSAKAAAAISALIAASRVGNRRCRTAGRALPAGGGRNRAGNRKDRRRRRESRGPARLATAARPAAAGRARRRSPASSARSRSASSRSSGTSGCGVHDQAGAFFRFAAAAFAIMARPCSGKHHRNDKAGIGGGKVEAAAVELHDRLGEAQAEARTRLRAALLEPHEALGGALAVGFVGNAGAIVGDRQRGSRRAFATARPARAACLRPRPAEYLMALSTMLDSAWPISSRLPVTTKRARRRRLRASRRPPRPPARRARRRRARHRRGRPSTTASAE